MDNFRLHFAEGKTSLGKAEHHYEVTSLEQSETRPSGAG